MNNDLVLALIAETRRSPFSRCEWCGHPCYGRACFAHRDLTQTLHAQQSPPHHLVVESAAGSEKNGA